MAQKFAAPTYEELQQQIFQTDNNNINNNNNVIINVDSAETNQMIQQHQNLQQQRIAMQNQRMRSNPIDLTNSNDKQDDEAKESKESKQSDDIFVNVNDYVKHLNITDDKCKIIVTNLANKISLVLIYISIYLVNKYNKKIDAYSE